ncbi:Histidine--tRNA ligase [bioreactor metagenome]|uniref:Histidine--tRNA ligase n=1 Tax=bioreactor metagenome TaxID=1076179 RepID=A0A645IH61_9ZZZZ
MARSVKAQMKFANKISASYTMVLGEDEVKNRLAKLKRMSDGETTEVSLDNMEAIAKLIKG